MRVVQTINYPSEGALSARMVGGWRGVIDVEVAGDYTFTAASNDGSHVGPQPLLYDFFCISLKPRVE